ncbi:MAG: hypothetical protein RMK91_01430 [Pseudanabaenaceae cyanobacterium SKYGB_i_bin29]|nr:hypothetical protein [Pseudanabaenaceae cyanobacterium SKYG29]MDW8420510.1 hypothetical protein [Pseudanabaenaceae cyanobacterium SKYGB_i_bin29]
MTSNWQGQTAVVATMHHKEKVIAPLLAEIGIQCCTIANFDTDRFGTFTRDIPRPHNQLETAKLKARSVLDLCDHPLAIASEGSFFPHPAIPLLACNREVVVLYDRRQDIYIWAEEVSTNTNFNHCQAKTWREVEEFAEKVGFPEHGLVVIADRITKGITDWEVLKRVVTEVWQQQTKVHIETDMRAMFNPTRMQNIAQATEKLVRKLQSHCPACNCPGFDVVEHRPGLPCAWCGTPTQQTAAIVYGCLSCSYTKEERVTPAQADPQFCPFCNP